MREYLKIKEIPKSEFNFWKVRHNQAVENPVLGFEFAIVSLLEGIENYRTRYRISFDSSVEDDYVLSEGIIKLAEGVRVLLNGDIGRLDAGTIDHYLVDVLRKCGEAV